MFRPDELPTTVTLDGRLLYLNTDWRDIKHCIKILSDDKLSDAVKANACLQIFVDNYMDIADGQNAIEALYNFIDCGEPPANSKGMPKEMDWDIDFSAIISDMNKVAGREIRREPYVHWFEFVAWYHAIGEGNLTYRVNIRRKLQKRDKLTPDESDWVRRNPEKAFLRDHIDDDEDDDD